MARIRPGYLSPPLTADGYSGGGRHCGLGPTGSIHGPIRPLLSEILREQNNSRFVPQISGLPRVFRYGIGTVSYGIGTVSYCVVRCRTV